MFKCTWYAGPWSESLSLVVWIQTWIEKKVPSLSTAAVFIYNSTVSRKLFNCFMFSCLRFPFVIPFYFCSFFVVRCLPMSIPFSFSFIYFSLFLFWALYSFPFRVRLSTRSVVISLFIAILFVSCFSFYYSTWLFFALYKCGASRILYFFRMYLCILLYR